MPRQQSRRCALDAAAAICAQPPILQSLRMYRGLTATLAAFHDASLHATI